MGNSPSNNGEINRSNSTNNNNSNNNNNGNGNSGNSNGNMNNNSNNRSGQGLNRTGNQQQGLRIQTDGDEAAATASTTNQATTIPAGSAGTINAAGNTASTPNAVNGSRFRNFVGRALGNRLSSGAAGSGGNGATGGNEGVDDKSESSIEISNDDHLEPGNLYCFVKAKTRLHGSKKVLRKCSWLVAKEGNMIRFGRGDECEMKLNDERCSPINASLFPANGAMNIAESSKRFILHPESRTYQLVGMGSRRSGSSLPITVGSIIKIGSVSLEVTSTCTDEGMNLYERFGTEMKQAADRQTRAKSASASRSVERKSVAKSDKKKPAKQLTNGSDAGSIDGSNIANGGNHVQQTQAQRLTQSVSNLDDEDASEINGGGNNQQTDILSGDELQGMQNLDLDGEAVSDNEDEEEGVIGNGKPLHILPEVTDPRDEMCYICWGGPSEEDLRGDLTNPNPLIRNPCGKCSGSSRYVHLECILKWIKTNNSGHCSVCNGPLPAHFSSPPPNIELKVVRHRRGESWVGTRRFRISFAEKNFAIIGRDYECDVKIRDRSVCGIHSRIQFDKETKTFLLQDCESPSGTFLHIAKDLALDNGSKTYVRVGRTIISLRVTDNPRALQAASLKHKGSKPKSSSKPPR